MTHLERFLPLARNENVTERQDDPKTAKGQWIKAGEIRTDEERAHAEMLVKQGNFRIVD